ncbi:methyltransferase domain-containing protein [Actinomadura sp. KC216]|uniref:class I SAM-dependent methyltransferase n=1 Tax=Actinomadura sp. KC216 TaxID=2530370 RepID=UPI00104410DF|nr:methyltransferase domain-containing protein [Actinomadura sp. KC216]TDB90615.1 methyltransferase domain-containing protein [Actinomadura sp. KC216]
MKQTIITAVVRQFGNPRGAAGRVAGWVLAHRSSNRRRNEWVVSLLDVRPADRVLEIGFGPGLAIAEVDRRIGPSGHVYGIDHSDVMVRQASRRNAAGIRAGRITLALASVEQLPPAFDGPFETVFGVNTLAFWTEPVRRLDDLRRRLAPGGRIAIASQPRHPGVTRDPARAAAETADLFRKAGLTQVRSETLDLDPPVICVLGVNPGPSQEPGRNG